jgi:hypothetical protein
MELEHPVNRGRSAIVYVGFAAEHGDTYLLVSIGRGRVPNTPVPP